jgi:hypothetical protein
VTAADERTDELLRPFLDAIDQSPDDPMPVCILRDRLHELGDGRAAGMDWLIENGKRPTETPWRGVAIWDWWPDMLPGPQRQSHLPDGAFERLRSSEEFGHGGYGAAGEAMLSAAAAVSTWLTGER